MTWQRSIPFSSEIKIFESLQTFEQQKTKTVTGNCFFVCFFFLSSSEASKGQQKNQLGFISACLNLTPQLDLAHCTTKTQIKWQLAVGSFKFLEIKQTTVKNSLLPVVFVVYNLQRG